MLPISITANVATTAISQIAAITLATPRSRRRDAGRVDIDERRMSVLRSGTRSTTHLAHRRIQLRRNRMVERLQISAIRGVGFNAEHRLCGCSNAAVALGCEPSGG